MESGEQPARLGYAMLVDNTIHQGIGVLGAIHSAARATGTSFEYLLATAQVESGFDPNASASSSSARGLFQFIEQTWLSTMKDYGPSLGYRRYADAIVRTASGRYEVPDPAMRRQILTLRHDPSANAVMAGAFTRANAAQLRARLGRVPSEGELYIAHFLGAAGAARLIGLASDRPTAAAAQIFPNAAKANRSIFFDGQRRTRSVAEVYRVLTGRYDIARATPHPLSGTAAAALSISPPVQTAAAPSGHARQAAEHRPVFPSLFSDGAEREPVSQVVRELWTTRPHVAAALTGQAAAPSATASVKARAPLDLFADQPAHARALFGRGS